MIQWYLFCLLICHQLITDVNTQQSRTVTGKGKIDPKPIFANNYIPASMHVMFHLTDLMKYELKPDATGSGSSGVSTTTTIRPTPPHKPGNYAPISPLGPTAYSRQDNQWKPWYRFGANDQSEHKPLVMSDLPEDIDLFGAGPSELIQQINSLEDLDAIRIEDDRINKFSEDYDDNVSLEYLRKKRVPPTRAYVTLLSLYDLLNKEAKELGLNKYNGYAEDILRELVKTSDGSVADQLKFVLSKVVEKKNTRKNNIVIKIKTLLADLDKPDSYMNEAIRYIPALQFSP